MDATVIIPTRGRAPKLAACLRGLAAQRGVGAFEVLVALDGPDDASRDAATGAWGEGAPGAHLRVLDGPRDGYNAARNRALAVARSGTILSLNDDVLPAPGLIAAHLRAQRAAERGAIVTGRSPWVVREPDRFFDRLVRESSMIFFPMEDRGRAHDWGYRYAWGMNVSMPTDAVRAAGGWTAFLRAYGYDDIEIAHRLRAQRGLAVLHEPDALAPHDHQIEPEAYLRREHELGRSAWMFAKGRREFALELFRRDITARHEIDEARAQVERDRAECDALRAWFASLVDRRAATATAGDIEEAYLRHLPLKRWTWRVGLLSVADESA